MILLLVRLASLIFFSLQIRRHIGLSLQSRGKIDRYTLATLGLLGISYLGFFVYRGLEISLEFAEAVTANNTEKHL